MTTPVLTLVRKLACTTILASLAAGACTCEDPAVAQLNPAVDAAPLAIDFGEVPVGVQRQDVITIRSIGQATLAMASARVQGAPVFAMDDQPPGFLPPGSSAPIVVRARPDTVGPLNGALLIASDDPQRPLVRVELHVVGVEQPPCDDGNECTEDRFDTDKSDCVHTFADGASCQPADRCIVDALCSQGVCLGRSKRCEDDSACTTDLCRQIDGECLHFVEEKTCDDSNPCTGDSCGETGCVHDMVASGTPCDDGDECTTGDECFSGACTGLGVGEGRPCDDGDSCTAGDTCRAGVCSGQSLIDAAAEGDTVFEQTLPNLPSGQSFLHRREASMGEDGVYYALDHLTLPGDGGLIHTVSTLRQCGTEVYEFAYRPPDSLVRVRHVRREMQLTSDDDLRIVVGVRQLPENGFEPQTTTYVLDKRGQVTFSRVRGVGGETGRSLLPDRSHIYGVVWPLNNSPSPMEATQNLVVVREDRNGAVLWRHERRSSDWAEFLGVAGPRVLFWASDRFGALDFNTGGTVWSSPTLFIAKEMALSTSLNLGVTRVDSTRLYVWQLLGVEIINGKEVFLFPAAPDPNYIVRTDPVIAPDGRILIMMQRSRGDTNMPIGLDWVELGAEGSLISSTPLPYDFPDGFNATRHEDWFDDPYPTVADDGVSYVGYGNSFWAIDPGGHIRWTMTSTIPHAYTGTVPLLRKDNILLISEGSRRLKGVKTNGGVMDDAGWGTFRHDGRRTKHTP